MSVLIKGMEMPTEGNWKTIRIYPDGTCAVPNWQGDCTLLTGVHAVKIPPHGRLIDENDVMKSAEELRQSPWYKANEFLHAIRKDGFEVAIDLTVKDAPTIIEAEEGE